MAEIKSRGHRKPWLRLWDEIITDPKMLSLTNAQFAIWIKLLCLANQQTTRGIIELNGNKFLPILEKILNASRTHLENCLEKFEKMRMIKADYENGTIVITNWNKRQFKSDDTTERTLQHYHSERSNKRSIEQVEQNRTEQKHPPKDVSVSAKSFLYNKGGDKSEKVALGAAPSPQSPNVESEKQKDAFKEKEGSTWTENLVQTPSTEKVAGWACGISTYELATQIIKGGASSELIRDVQDLLHGGASTNEINHLLWFTKTYGMDYYHGPRAYFRKECIERNLIKRST